jgi:hypothetical protein
VIIKRYDENRALAIDLIARESDWVERAMWGQKHDEIN